MKLNAAKLDAEIDVCKLSAHNRLRASNLLRGLPRGWVLRGIRTGEAACGRFPGQREISAFPKILPLRLDRGEG